MWRCARMITHHTSLLTSHHSRGPCTTPQVYRARLKDGRAVAVKVQRPDLYDAVLLDIHVLRTIAHLLQSMTNARSDLVGVTDNTVGRILLELDYRNEANNAKRFRELFQSRDVCVPQVYEELSTSKVLTMEWMEGIPLADARLDESGLEPGPVIELGVKVSLDQMLNKGFFHAVSDAHAFSVPPLCGVGGLWDVWGVGGMKPSGDVRCVGQLWHSATAWL